MRVSILTPNLSANCLGRAYVLAKILQPKYEVEIVGPIFGQGIWEPVKDDKSISYRGIEISRNPLTYLRVLRLTKLISGDIIYASKPVFTSYGIGLLKKIVSGKPLVLDIDDWELGFKKDAVRNASWSKKLLLYVYYTIFFFRHDSYWNVLAHEKMAALADSVTVSNLFLKNKFGGEIIYHARDTEAFDPDLFDGEEMRRKYGVPVDKKVVMFLGSPRKHKGIEDLIEALHLAGREDVLLVIVGLNEKEDYCSYVIDVAKDKLNEGFQGFGFQPFEAIPEFLSFADLIVIPQKERSFSEGQMPAKIFDAMAMAKPVIATDVGDLSRVLGDTGVVVPVDDVHNLKDAINDLLDSEEKRKNLGQKARTKCIAEYSWNAVGVKLRRIFSDL